MSKKEKAPKPEKAPRTKKNFFDKAWDFFGAVGRKPWFRVCEIVLASLLVVMLIFYSAALLFAEESSFSIEIGDTSSKGKSGEGAMLSLSETEDFANPTVRLDMGGVEGVTNITSLDLPKDIDGEGGSHNGLNFLAYTFYLKNSGSEVANIRSELNIENVYKGVDEAIRIRVYKNGNDETYAKRAKDGKPEHNTTPFYDDAKAFSVLEEGVQPEEIIKYTIVVWIEGNDPECRDNIRGGDLRASLAFSLE